jgi:hypothetical protein
MVERSSYSQISLTDESEPGNTALGNDHLELTYVDGLPQIEGTASPPFPTIIQSSSPLPSPSLPVAVAVVNHNNNDNNNNGQRGDGVVDDGNGEQLGDVSRYEDNEMDLRAEVGALRCRYRIRSSSYIIYITFVILMVGSPASVIWLWIFFPIVPLIFDFLLPLSLLLCLYRRWYTSSGAADGAAAAAGGGVNDVASQDITLRTYHDARELVQILNRSLGRCTICVNEPPSQGICWNTAGAAPLANGLPQLLLDIRRHRSQIRRLLHDNNADAKKVITFTQPIRAANGQWINDIIIDVISSSFFSPSLLSSSLLFLPPCPPSSPSRLSAIKIS